MSDKYEADTVIGSSLLLSLQTECPRWTHRRIVTIEEERSKLLDSLKVAAEEHDIPYEHDPHMTITVGDVDADSSSEIRLQRSTLLELAGQASDVDMDDEDRLERVTDLLERHKYDDVAELLTKMYE